MKAVMLTLLAVLCAGSVASCAQIPTTPKYPPGTVGYIVKECRSDMQKSTPKEYLKGECYKFQGSFVSGTFGPFMMHHHEIHQHDMKGTQIQKQECRDIIKEEQTRIKKNQFCWKKDGNSIWPSNADFAYMVSSWGEWLESHDPDVLDKPIFPYFNSALNNGPFCQYFVDTKGKYIKADISKALAQASYDDWIDAQKASEEESRREHESEIKESKNKHSAGFIDVNLYKSCLKGIEQSANDPAMFGTTKCGTFMAPFLSGMVFTDVIDDNAKPTGICAEDMERMYKYEIYAKNICLSKKMTLLEATKIILNNIDYDAVKDEISWKKKGPDQTCHSM